MQVKVQVVTMTDDGQETTQEVACIERQDLTPVTLGLSLAEGKAVLQALQEVVVEWRWCFRFALWQSGMPYWSSRKGGHDGAHSRVLSPLSKRPSH
jgi:hypothetical protein